MDDWYRETYGPYGSPAHQMSVATATNSAAYKQAVEDVCEFVETLNDMYHWNEWVCEKIKEKFLAD